jgi:RimJ/RimL family protein N-acetyltransferase
MIPHEARAAASRTGQDLVKGMGSVDAVKRMKAAWLREKLVFSKASKSQCDLLYKWANDSEARKNSFNPEQIPYETHVKWFEGKLRSSSSYIFVGFIDSTPVGQVRIDIDGLSAMISYSIDKEWRGMGLGNAFLQELPGLLEKHDIKVDRLIGKVKVGNLQSQKAFERAGFQKHEEKGFFEYVKDL